MEIALPATAFSPSTPSAFFDLDAGTIGTETGLDDATMDDVGNGWFRCSVIATADANAAGAVNILLSSGSETVSYNGDGTSGLFLWGAQVEALAYPTSYIATEGSSETRGEDGLTHPATTLDILSAAGTIYFSYTPISDTPSLGHNSNRASIFRIAATNAMQIHVNASARLDFVAYDGGYKTAFKSFTPARGTTIIGTVKWDGTNITVYVDGAAGTPVACGALDLAGLASFLIGHEPTANRACDGMLRDIHVFGEAHADALVSRNADMLAAAS